MGIRKKGAARSELVDVWRKRLRVPIHTSYPVVEIVDHDQENIWPLVGVGVGEQEGC